MLRAPPFVASPFAHPSSTSKGLRISEMIQMASAPATAGRNAVVLNRASDDLKACLTSGRSNDAR
eukprot:scaffold157810_cov42-Prasinocladus_malaysianus.AAC.1